MGFWNWLFGKDKQASIKRKSAIIWGCVFPAALLATSGATVGILVSIGAFKSIPYFTTHIASDTLKNDGTGSASIKVDLYNGADFNKLSFDSNGTHFTLSGRDINQHIFMIVGTESAGDHQIKIIGYEDQYVGIHVESSATPTPTLKAVVDGSLKIGTSRTAAIVVTGTNGAVITPLTAVYDTNNLIVSAFNDGVASVDLKTGSAANNYVITISNGSQTCTCQITIEQQEATKSLSLTTNITAVMTNDIGSTNIIGTVVASNFNTTAASLALYDTTYFENFSQTSGTEFTVKIKSSTTAGTYNLTVKDTAMNVVSNAVVISVITPAVKSLSITVDRTTMIVGDTTTTITGTATANNFSLSALAITGSDASKFDGFSWTSGNTFYVKLKASTTVGDFKLQVIDNINGVSSNEILINVSNQVIKTLTLTATPNNVGVGGSAITGTISSANFTVTTLALTNTAQTYFENFSWSGSSTFTCTSKTSLSAGIYDLSVVANSANDNIISNNFSITVSYDIPNTFPNTTGTNWEGYRSGSLTLNLNSTNHTANISGQNSTYCAKNLVIPPYVKDDMTGLVYMITSITGDCFNQPATYRNDDIAGSLTLPDTITEIPDNGLRRLNGLNGSLTLPSHIKNIGANGIQHSYFTGALILPSSLQYSRAHSFLNAQFSTIILQGWESLHPLQPLPPQSPEYNCFNEGAWKPNGRLISTGGVTSAAALAYFQDPTNWIGLPSTWTT